MVWLSVTAFFIALVCSGMIVRWSRRLRVVYGEDMPQRFHRGNVPRIGGLALLVALLLSWTAGMASTVLRGDTSFLRMQPWVAWFMLALLPAVLGGLAEDLTQRLSVRWRLLLTALTAVLGIWLLGLSVPRLDLPGVDRLLAWGPWIGMGIALLAIAGLPHAFNIIDGYNGLAGMVAIIVCLALAHVSLQLGDRALAALLLSTAAATAGFLVWNYPRGMLFAGDGGAYIWGVVIAFSSILLVQRHSLVSPWFPMLLLIYPVWETVFSVYRKLARGVSPGMADALHFHQLVYRRIVWGVFHDDESRQMLMRNNRTSPYLWAFTLVTVLPAVLFWSNTPVLMAFCALFMIGYVCAYLAIVRFKVPGWLQK